MSDRQNLSCLLDDLADKQKRVTQCHDYYAALEKEIENLIKDQAGTQKQLDDVQGEIDVIKNQIRSVEIQNAPVVNELRSIDVQLKQIDENKLQQKIEVKDDLGLGLESATYTLGAILMQAHSHVIHHFASVGYIIYQLDIELPDEDFGFNPTTPNKNLRAS